MNQRTQRPYPVRRRTSPLLLKTILSEHKTMPKSCRVSGIYQEGAKFRVVVYWPDRASIWCQTREEAEAVKATLEEKLRTQGARTVGQAIDEYLSHLARNGRKASSLQTITRELRQFLPEDALLSTLTEKLAAELYHAETERTSARGRPIAAATHRHKLKTTKAFFRWLVEDQKYLQTNPFARIKPIGRENTGKPQLRIDEARRFHSFLVTQAETEEPARAILTLLLLGVRPSEVLLRRVRDVDDNGRLYCIETGKTANARRSLEVQSEPLQRFLSTQTAGRHPDEYLFGIGRTRPHHRNYLANHLRRYCRLAGVPLVCPHSLRGLHSTLAIERGATSGLVSAALGHGSFTVTARHYVEPSALANAKGRRVAAALTPELAAVPPTGPSSTPPAELSAYLATLTPEQLAELLRSVEKPQ